MIDWWVLPAAKEMGQLSAREWQELLAGAAGWPLWRGQRVVWGPARGVLVIQGGAVRLATETHRSPQLFHLRDGDMIGTLQAAPAVLEVLAPTTLYCFKHDEWVATLQRSPAVAEKLLHGMAWSVLQREALGGVPPRAGV